ncbi:hypothetical protein A6U87_24405 [Rhizobium sp. AC44/96]|uniref:hypothetical protein n=1 Tax=Rhizobium sp. AC44/96 TaxID=1841654 RepID=UPI00080F90C3|nr:hypothetical protein [Rhizobium sp. AC44/96]OCJ15269.1 hypothetical protein A6U87_24405 [Rhizobium sp. AC44/96]
MDNPNNIPASCSLLLAVAVNGTNAKPYPQHAYVWCAADAEGKSMLSNLKTNPENIGQHNDKVFHHALLEAVKGVGIAIRETARAAAVRLTIITPNGSEFHNIFRQPIEARRKAFYLRSNGERWVNETLIKLIDCAVEAHGLILDARPPESEVERNFLAATQTEAGRRWKALRRAIKEGRS